MATKSQSIPQNSSNPQHGAEAPPPYSQYSTDTPTSTAITPPSTVASLSSLRSASSTPPPAAGTKDTPRRPPADDTPESSKPSLPSKVIRARAPLRVRQENSSINSNFLVYKGEDSNPKPSDISLQTKNARISSAVYVDAEDWGRPVVIEAETKNSSIALAVHTLRPGQAVHITAETKNSSNNLLLPRDFKGLLSLSTTHGSDSLSAELQKAAVRVSAPDEFSGDADDSLVGNLVKTLTTDEHRVVWYEINGSSGPSRAVVRTKNSKVSAGFVGEEKEKAGGGSSCVVM